jgi:hypothetical protein
MRIARTVRIQKGALAFVALFVVAAWSSSADQQPATIENKQLSVTAGLQGGSYEIRTQGSKRAVFRSGVAAEIDHLWLKSADFPHFKTVRSAFTDGLGKGQMLTTTYWGLPDRPSLISTIRLYDDLPFGDTEVKVQNSTNKLVTVQAIRSVEVIGSPRIDLGGREDAARVLSDSFSEDRPTLHIYDLGKAPVYLGSDRFGKEYSDTHLAVGSQLIYNLESHQSLFLGALTSQRWLTVLHLGVTKSVSNGFRVVSYTVESTGTTEIEKKESLQKAPPENQIELSLSVPPGGGLASERLLFSAGPDYHKQLQAYGEAVGRLNQARVTGQAPSGWWSWIPYYTGITGGLTLTNAQWLAEHLQKYGYNYIMIDEGYEYAYGEYTTPNAVHFPEGMLSLSHRICNLGLKFGVWTAPFEVSERAWVYQHHKEWLVHNAGGKPIQIVGYPPDERIYVLDSTYPGAQDYLRRTYRTMVREWGVRYFKFDFMDDTAIEGFHYRAGTTALQAQRIGLEVIRKAVGEDVLIDKDGSPMLNPVGLVDEGRISTDTSHSFEGSKTAAAGIAARYYMHHNFFVNDPDAFSVSGQSVVGESGKLTPPLSFDEAEVAIVLAAISGSMFELGDDLTLLESEPERLALAQNPDLLQMVKLNRAAVPLDLMSYASEDEQPSIFVLHQDARQTMLAVFNWTDVTRSHSFRWSDLQLPAGRHFELSDVLHQDAPMTASQDSLELRDQPPHSVRLIKVADTAVPAEPPSLTINVPSSAEVAKPMTASVSCDPEGVPALTYHWDFGDGTSAEGPQVAHTYARSGTFSIKITAEGVDGVPANKTAPIRVTGVVDIQFHFTKNRRYIESDGR